MQQQNCKCGLAAAVRTVKKQGPNLGRQFYGCSKYPAPDECKFFAWLPPGAVQPPAAGGAQHPRGSRPQQNQQGGGQQQHQQHWHHYQQQHQHHGQPPTLASPAAAEAPQRAPQSPGGAGLHAYPYGMLAANGAGWQRSPAGPSSPGMPSQGGSQPSHGATPGRRLPTSLLQQGAPQQGQQAHGRKLVGGDAVRVELQAVNEDTFGASFKFHMGLKEYIRCLPPPCVSRWDGDRKLWTFSMAHYDQVIQQLQHAPVPVNIVPIPAAVLDRFLQGQQGERLGQDEVEARLERIPRDIWGKLYSFQREGVRYAVERGGRALIADEMGLGKTVQALCAAACFGPEDWPLLIVCPSTMKLVWREACLDWLPPEVTPDQHNLAVIKDGKGIKRKLGAMDADSGVRIVIVSYEMVKKMEEDLAGFKTIIVDESHHLKTLTAQRTVCLDRLVRRCRRAILMTGTPALSRPIELFPQINMLRPGLFGSFDYFGMRYCDGKPAMNRMYASPGSGMDYRGSSCEGELHSILSQQLMIRRLKNEVLSELPEKVRMKVPVDMDAEHAGCIQAVKAKMKEVEADSSLSENEVAQQRQVLLSELYRRTGPAKVKAAESHIKSLLESGEKLLVFGHHQEVLNSLQEEVFEAGDRKFVRIDGQVVNERRKAAVDTFQGDERCRAALLSITAAGVGITLTAATVVVFVELYWNPGHLIQAEDRAHRVGQRQSLKVHYLLAEGTADDIIWPLCNRKLKVVGRSVAGATGLDGGGYCTTAELLAKQAEREAGGHDLEEIHGEGERLRHQQLAAGDAEAGAGGGPGGEWGDDEGPSDSEAEAGGSGSQQQRVQRVQEQEQEQRGRVGGLWGRMGQFLQVLRSSQQGAGAGAAAAEGAQGADDAQQQLQQQQQQQPAAAEVVEVDDGSDEEGPGPGRNKMRRLQFTDVPPPLAQQQQQGQGQGQEQAVEGEEAIDLTGD